MKTIVKYLRRWALFNKRLLKKPGFLVILLLVPLLVGALSISSQREDSGILTVALACENDRDRLAREIKKELLREDSLIHFVDAETDTEALELVRSGEVDSAWIFPDDMQEQLDEFTKSISRRKSFVTIVQRENNVLMQLSYEKLCAVLYPYCSESLYLNFIRTNFDSLDDISDKKLMEYYASVNAEGENIFSFSSVTPDSKKSVGADYLLAPMRGLQAVLIVIGGLAVSLFYMQDASAGKFDWVPTKRKPVLSLAYHLTAVVDIALAVLLSLFISGLSVSFWREAVAMTLFVLISVGFCIMLRLLCKDIRLFGAIIPVVTIAMIVFCPVFFNNIRVPILNYLLPPYYYLRAIYNTSYLYYMAIYGVCVYLFNYILFRIRER